MSYLHLPRIIFSGDFISDVSTVNNDPAHYNNNTFQPSFQEYGTGAKNGWWNPEGGATFDFQDCIIRKITYADNTVEDQPGLESLVGQLIKSPGGRSTGKMVDLDPQQQGVSQLWAVRLRILTKDDELLLEGDIDTTAFRDLQLRQYDGGKVNGQPLGASWTSVIRNITWGEQSDSFRVLRELRSETQENCLSVNLNGFGYYYAHAADGRFSLGRLIGAIGPWYANEPKTFVAQRRLFATQQYGDPNRPSTYFGISNFLYEKATGRLAIDMGNSFPVANPLGEIDGVLPLFLGIAKSPLANAPSVNDVLLTSADVIEIAGLVHEKGDWLMRTGGIFDLSNVPQELAENQLVLMYKTANDTYRLFARESIGGYNMRAEEMVVRLDTGQKQQVQFFARQWGEPVYAASVTIQPDQPTNPKRGPICIVPGNNYPEDGLSFSQMTIPVRNGYGSFVITGNEISNPRGYIDGQMYFIAYSLDGIQPDPADSSGDAISVHLRDYFPVPDQPRWSDITATMQQFSNLYPIMSKYIVDLGDRDAVLAKKEILLFAFSQEIHSPIYMPVTRDLSEGKRLTILKWLESNGIYDLPEEDANLSASRNKAFSQEIPNMETTEEGHAPSEFHQKLVMAMRMKMGAGLPNATFDLTQF